MPEPDNSSPKPKSEKMTNAGYSAQSQGGGDFGSGMQPCPNQKSEDHWVEIHLVDEDGLGIANTRCIVTAPDGKRHRTKTDANGVIRLEGIPKGKCQVSFTDLSKNAWDPVS